jgi:hypothetical protein
LWSLLLVECARVFVLFEVHLCLLDLFFELFVAVLDLGKLLLERVAHAFEALAELGDALGEHG